MAAKPKRMVARPIGTYKCPACKMDWDGSQLRERLAPGIDVFWTCRNLMCETRIDTTTNKVSDEPKAIPADVAGDGESHFYR
jgi:uncharacterized protein YlaI